jgi:hypothetical protein
VLLSQLTLGRQQLQPPTLNQNHPTQQQGRNSDRMQLEITTCHCAALFELTPK